MDVPLFTTPPTVDLPSNTEPPPTVGIIIAVVVIVVLIMLVAAVLVAIVVYYQYRKRLVRETFSCAHGFLSIACVTTPDMICILFVFFHCRNQPSEYDVDSTEGGNDVKLQKNPAYDTVQLSGCSSSSAPEYENVQLQTV